MDLIFILNQSLPKLAWIANVDLEKQQTIVVHGPWVEKLERGFIEGAWDGDFTNTTFDTSACVFGSGAVVNEKSIIFVSSTSTTDYLYWWSNDNGNRVTVANSLPLLLANLDDELDSQIRDYDSINESIVLGINRYIRNIPTKKGSVNRLMHWNLKVSPEQILEQDKPLPLSFKTFGDYSAYLATTYRELASNAKDRRRSRPMAIFSTQSKGYDSTAANVVAKDSGIDLVFTVTKGKKIGYYANEDGQFEVDDDGAAICTFLGLRNIPIDRRAIETNSKTEYLFYAGMHSSSDFNLLQIASHIVQPTILITGTLGEIWYPAQYYKNQPNTITQDLVRGDLGTHSLTEIRLQAGYVQLAFPYIGARNRADILRISESEEMEPWRLRTDYDRPIPRRLAEQAGLARNMFGQKKMASVLEFPPPTIPIDKQLQLDYLDYLVNEGILTRWQTFLLPLAQRYNSVISTTSPKRHIWNYYLQRVISKLLRRQFYFPLVWMQMNSSLFCFCVNKRTRDYHSALQQTD